MEKRTCAQLAAVRLFLLCPPSEVDQVSLSETVGIPFCLRNDKTFTIALPPHFQLFRRLSSMIPRLKTPYQPTSRPLFLNTIPAYPPLSLTVPLVVVRERHRTAGVLGRVTIGELLCEEVVKSQVGLRFLQACTLWHSSSLRKDMYENPDSTTLRRGG